MAGCSCNSGKSNKYSNVSDLLKSSHKRKEMAELTPIDKELFVKGDKYSILKFLHCADEKAFVKAFEEYDELDLEDGFSDEDLRIMADMWESGEAKDIGLDVEKALKEMKVNPKKLAICSVKFV